jgi:hypothetical protein
LKVDNEGEQLSLFIAERLTTRLEGVCQRLGVAECAGGGFFDPFVPELLCIRGSGVGGCSPQGDTKSLSKALADALANLPAEAKDAMVRQGQRRQAEPIPAPGQGSGDAGSSDSGTQQQPSSPQSAEPSPSASPSASPSPSPSPSQSPLDLPDGGGLDSLSAGEPS